ncbi:MAG: GNAT family N-acetyltransferase [Lewinellaceae bacterium]|nr:GNAT family N-acetyltransferase [Lewinellaceae bacterium]
MFLRSYRRDDKRRLQQLFFDTVRTVNAGDYPHALLNAWAPDEPDRELWSQLERQNCFLVEFQKTPVGFISLSPSGSIDFLYVHKDFQGRGIAAALYKQVERIARKKGLETLRTDTSVTARGFFEKQGFTMLSEQKRLLRGHELRLCRMEKKLPQPAKNSGN